LDEKADTVESTTVKTANGPCFSVETKTNSESKQHANSATELMGMSTNNRVSLLRQLSKAQALMLIDDLNTAIAQNREEDIAKVVALIQEKDLPIEAIISRIDAA
jgi:purine nucleoside phosphorylase